MLSSRYFLALFMLLPLICQAEGHLVELEKDPFKQPDILKYKPPASSPNQQRLEPEEVIVPQLKLSATLISVTEPMVIVNDTLVHIGETIEDMKLIIIDEGRAVFRFKGKNYEFTLDNDNPDTRK